MSAGSARTQDPQLLTPRSEELYRDACEVIPGGVNSPVRAMRSIGREPIFIERGEGCELFDVDGNRYVDWVCSWGPLILGHSHPAVIAAVQEAAASGTSFGAPTAGEVELAGELTNRFESVEMVRFVSSGTEAAMSAVRLARAATGRDTIVKFAGAYHGHADGLLAEAGSGLATQGIPASPGVTTAQAADVRVIGWNDRAALAAAFAEARLAAVIAEPVPANMGLVPPESGFLEALRGACDEGGALLILDEVISGFRIAAGGAQEHLCVSADLTLLGKGLGGGLPAAAYGGRRELMELIAPAGEVYQAGTLSGNPLAVAAGLATLAELDATAYKTLAQSTERLARVLADAARQAGAEERVEIVWLPGLLTVFFSSAPVGNFEAALACDQDAYGRFCRAMLERGIYPPASQYEAWFVSLAHDAEAIDRTGTAAAEAFAEALS